MMEGIVHSLAVQFANWLNRRLERDHKEYLRMTYGTEVVLINITKMTIITIVAVLLNMVAPTIAVLVGFNVIRRNAFGLHANTSIGCTLTSISLMTLVPFFCESVRINNIQTMFIFAAIAPVIYFYAPADTEARPIVSLKKRTMLKKKAVIACGLLCAIVLLIPDHHYKFLVTLGAVYEAVFIMPVTYKLLNRSYDNYKKYLELKGAPSTVK